MKSFYSILIIILLTSCSSAGLDIAGVWANIEAYSNWKENAPEDVVARIAEVDGLHYLALPNSIVISLEQEQFLVPGGEWRITSKTIKGNNVRLGIESNRNAKNRAVIIITFKSKDSIYFILESLEGNMQNEMDEAFLLLGKEFIYHRCDRNET